MRVNRCAIATPTPASSSVASRSCSDWSGDLYGRWVELELTARLRGERKFDGVAALKDAIAADVSRARDLLGVAAAS